jgi:hypothetical protein
MQAIAFDLTSTLMALESYEVGHKRLTQSVQHACV